MKIFYNRLNFNQINPAARLQAWLKQRLPCPLCDAPAEKPDSLNSHTPLCHACAASLPWYISTRCPQCALPTFSGTLCGTCLQHPPAFDITLSTFRYAYPLDRMLQQFKYHQHLPIGNMLAATMLPGLASLMAENTPDIMFAMPMHTQRVQQRGFNHALELAKHLQPYLQIPLEIEGCTRVVDTPSQAGMDMKTRTRNLRGAFASAKNWEGKHVMVVDDVMTTGASMHALAKVLKKSGAGRVTALVLARTLKSTDG